MKFLEIEKIILEDDARGMSSLYEKIKKGYIERSTDLILNTNGKIFISSGFYILNSKSPETDGPPGVIALAKTLTALGNDVFIVTDKFSIDIFKGMYHKDKVLEFPILSHVESNSYANKLIKEIDPKLLISIERAGFADDGKYRNFKFKDGTSPLDLERQLRRMGRFIGFDMNKGGSVSKKKKGYAKGGLKATKPDQKGLKKLPTSVRNKMGYMSKGGMAKKGVMSYNMGGMVKSQVNNLKKAKR